MCLRARAHTHTHTHGGREEEPGGELDGGEGEGGEGGGVVGGQEELGQGREAHEPGGEDGHHCPARARRVAAV